MNENPREEPGLFDLPLAPPDAAPEEAPEPHSPPQPRRAHNRERAKTLPLFGEAEPGAEATDPGPDSGVPSPADAPRPAGPAMATPVPAMERPRRPVPVPAPSPEPPGPAVASIAARLRASFGDLLILAAALAVAILGVRWFEVPLRPAQMAPFGLFLLAFSYLYSVISLAFWGQTPGMAWAGVVARTEAAEPLSFSQTSLRWIGTGLAWTTLGLLGVFAFSGRSLADRLSASIVVRASDGEADAELDSATDVR